MELVTIVDPAEIEKCHERFVEQLKDGAESIGIRGISFRQEKGSGKTEETVYWLTGKEVWAAFGRGHNRFWNPFGLGDPSKNQNLDITVEINPPYQGIDRRTAGAFAKDPTTGLVCLVHRGNMGGGKKGVGKNSFLAEYTNPLVTVFDEGHGQSPAVLVGMLDDPGFVAGVTDFVKTVDDIKGRLSEEPHPLPGGPVLDKNTPEFEGLRKPYTIKKQIQAEHLHGEVRNALAVEVGHYGTCSNTKTPDGNRPDILLTFEDLKRGSALFEVKTDVTPGSIYTAIGQLLYYARLYKPNPGLLVGVFPDDIKLVVRNRIESIGLEVMTFKRAGKSIQFEGLKRVVKNAGV